LMDCTSGSVTPIQWLTLVIAAIGAGVGFVIAYRQWRTAQNRLRLDLFDRRLVVYEAAMFFVASVLNNSKILDGVDTTYMEKTRSVRWLFDKAFEDHLLKYVYHEALNLHAITAEMPAHKTQAERKAAIEKQRAKKEQLSATMRDLESRAAPYLELKDK